MHTRSVAVFCGSRQGARQAYAKDAAELGMLLAALDLNLIYGGGRIGMMGVLADSMLQHGGKITGVIPRILVEWEQQHAGLTELIITENMHQRKKTMYELCDAAAVLPGGFGSLDEMFEMLTWNQLNIHDKKIFLLNTQGYYNYLIAHIRHAAAEGFLYDEFERRVYFCSSPAELINCLP